MQSTQILESLIKAREVVTARMVAEPYNMHLVSDRIKGEMFGQADDLAHACIEAFGLRQNYSPFTLSQMPALRNLKYTADYIQEVGSRHAEINLPDAFDVLEITYGQYVEFQVSQSIVRMIMDGKTAEEIQIEQARIRKEKGLGNTNTQTDGKQEFEAELLSALQGKVIDYPVKAPLRSYRRFSPYFEPGEYVIAAGRTGMGKSYFGLNCLYSCAVDGVPGAYINLENTPKDVQKRLFQMRANFKFERDLTRITDDQSNHIVSCWEWVKACPIKVFHPGRNLQAIVNTIRRDYMDRGTQLFVVDYVQLMRDGDGRKTRLDELSNISATLRELALELGVVVMALAQINRGPESSASKRPHLSDLRGSGDLEQDATTVLILYRPGYYNIHEDENGNPYPENYADIHIAKGRNTGPAMVKCCFNEVLGFYDTPADPFQKSINAQPVSDYAIFNAYRQEPPEDVPF